MPWKECSVMDERMQFVARRLAGEAMAELCRLTSNSRLRTVLARLLPAISHHGRQRHPCTRS